ncbi:MAG: SDR family oxidoreductase [Melioribacter sp.]|nr:SDR family oxidoreductase [Melioribacter sp.]
MILITGANGNLGRTTIEFLLKKNPNLSISALVRSEEKANDLKSKGIQVVVGDYFDYKSLLNAMQDIEILLFISSSTLKDRFTQHLNVVNAAKESKIKHIIYTSVLRAKPNSKFTAGIDHYKTEQEILNSGINYTIMRNTYYAEILPAIVDNAFESGVIYYSAGQAKANFALRTEMAEANAAILLEPYNHQNKVYEITSLSTYNFDEIAAMLSEIFSRKIEYIDIPVKTLKDNLSKLGMPYEIVDLMGSVAESIREGEFNYIGTELEKLIGRRPTDLKDFLKNFYSSKKED